MTFSISVGKLRQNPTEAFDEVEAGREVIVTRNNREIAKLVPTQPRRAVTAEDAAAVYREAPLSDSSWSREVDAARDEVQPDVWGER